MIVGVAHREIEDVAQQIFDRVLQRVRRFQPGERGHLEQGRRLKRASAMKAIDSAVGTSRGR